MSAGETRVRTLYALVLAARGRNSTYLQSRLLNEALAGPLGWRELTCSTQRVQDWGRLRRLRDSSEPVIYHFASFDPVAFLFARRAKTVFVYHNQTPARFFLHYRPRAALLAGVTNVQLRLFPKTMAWVAVSEFNRDRLRSFGFHRVEVCPCIVARGPGSRRHAKTETPSVLFVGRIDANKNCVELMAQVAAAAAVLGTRVVLRIVGDTKRRCAYGRTFERSLMEHSRGGALTVEWHRDPISNEALDSLYSSSWVYVSTSLHEGFGLPPCEAVLRGTPALYLSCGGTETVLEGQGEVPRAQRWLFADRLANLLRSERLRRELLAAQTARVENCTTPKVLERAIPLYSTLLGANSQRVVRTA
jgi:glycosyltransferase involved in cell wall biosynthesis